MAYRWFRRVHYPNVSFMPRLLKSETARRLLVGQRALSTAFSLLSTPKTVSHQPDKSDGAIEIGLVGIAAELAISACLYEILGPGAIVRKGTGFYITAGEALAKFRATITSGIPRLSLLTQGIPIPDHHLRQLDQACARFKVLFTSRAAAVHAGEGTSSDVVFCVGKDVASFFELLAASPKWKPYLKDVPVVPTLPKERTLLAQELAVALKRKDKATVGAALANIFLVLPDLTDEAPEWLSALERVHVNPKSNDISILLKALQNAKVGDLLKVGKGTSGIATKIEPDNPNAMPIYVAGMKKKFENAADSWNAYVGQANAELDRGILALPPIAAVYGFSALGIDGIGLPPEEVSDGLQAHVVWPFIAAALNYNGTKGPCFFLARALRADEGGQLSSLLKKAANKSTTLAKALKDYLPLIESTATKQPASVTSTLLTTLTKSSTTRDEKRENLADLLAERRKYTRVELHPKYDKLIAIFAQSDSVGACITAVVERKIEIGDDIFPLLRELISAASDREDIAPLARVVTENALTMVATNARKGIAEIDYVLFGPQAIKVSKSM